MTEAAEQLLSEHEASKKIRQRGEEAPPQLAAVALLQNLEREFDQIRQHLDDAWAHIDNKNFRKCSRHTDQAQQRLHKVIRKLTQKADAGDPNARGE